MLIMILMIIIMKVMTVCVHKNNYINRFTAALLCSNSVICLFTFKVHSFG